MEYGLRNQEAVSRGDGFKTDRYPKLVVGAIADGTHVKPNKMRRYDYHLFLW